MCSHTQRLRSWRSSGLARDVTDVLIERRIGEHLSPGIEGREISLRNESGEANVRREGRPFRVPIGLLREPPFSSSDSELVLEPGADPESRVRLNQPREVLPRLHDPN